MVELDNIIISILPSILEKGISTLSQIFDLPKTVERNPIHKQRHKGSTNSMSNSNSNSNSNSILNRDLFVLYDDDASVNSNVSEITNGSKQTSSSDSSSTASDSSSISKSSPTIQSADADLTSEKPKNNDSNSNNVDGTIFNGKNVNIEIKITNVSICIFLDERDKDLGIIENTIR